MLGILVVAGMCVRPWFENGVGCKFGRKAGWAQRFSSDATFESWLTPRRDCAIMQWGKGCQLSHETMWEAISTGDKVCGINNTL